MVKTTGRCWLYFTKTDVPYVIPANKVRAGTKPTRKMWQTFCDFCQPDKKGEGLNSTGINTLWRHLTKCPAASEQAKEEANKVLQPHSRGATGAVQSDQQRQEKGQKLFEGRIPRLDNPRGYILISGVKAGSSFSWAEIEQAHQLIAGLAAADQARSLQIEAALVNLRREGAGLEPLEEDWEADFEAEHVEALYENHKAATCSKYPQYCSKYPQ